jgi:hypothetical protein
MDPELLKSNWALLAAVGIGLIIALIVLSQLIRRSAWGQLRETRRTLAEARQGAARALQAVEKAARIAKRLHERAEHTKPRHVQEANEVLSPYRRESRTPCHTRRVSTGETGATKKEVFAGTSGRQKTVFLLIGHAFPETVTINNKDRVL